MHTALHEQTALHVQIVVGFSIFPAPLGLGISREPVTQLHTHVAFAGNGLPQGGGRITGLPASESAARGRCLLQGLRGGSISNDWVDQSRGDGFALQPPQLRIRRMPVHGTARQVQTRLQVQT